MSKEQHPQEIKIPLIELVKTHTAVELRDMPYLEMVAALDAQESYFMIEKSTRMGGAAIELRRLMQSGSELVKKTIGKKTKYEIDGNTVKPSLIKQLAKRGFIEV